MFTLLFMLFILFCIATFFTLAILGARGIWFWIGYLFCLASMVLVATAAYYFIFWLF